MSVVSKLKCGKLLSAHFQTSLLYLLFLQQENETLCHFKFKNKTRTETADCGTLKLNHDIIIISTGTITCCKSSDRCKYVSLTLFI